MAISADDRAESEKLASDLDLRFPLLADTDLRVAAEYGVVAKGRDIAVPAVFIIREDRRILWEHIGETITDRPADEDILEQVNLARRAR